MTEDASKKPIPHPQISEVKIVEGRNVFPISWLHKQDFCEYSIFLEYMKGIKVEPTKEMIEGEIEHEQMDIEFREKALPIAFKKMLEQSKMEACFSRNFSVRSLKYGIYGKIDEIHFTPDEFLIIDDKPDKKVDDPFPSDIHQVLAYCLVFKDMIKQYDSRRIVAALRKEKAKEIGWKKLFDEKAENKIVKVIDRIHRLILETEQFNSSKNSKKCKGCRFVMKCDRAFP